MADHWWEDPRPATLTGLAALSVPPSLPESTDTPTLPAPPASPWDHSTDAERDRYFASLPPVPAPPAPPARESAGTWQTLKDIGGAVGEMVRGVPGVVAQQMEGVENSYATRDWKDRWIEENQQRQQQNLQFLRDQGEYDRPMGLGIPFSRGEFAQWSQSLPQTLATMGPAMVGSAVGTAAGGALGALGGPAAGATVPAGAAAGRAIGSFLGGMVGSYLPAGSAAANQFIRDALDRYRQDFQAKAGRDPTPSELDAYYKTTVEPQAGRVYHGESLPEAVGTAAEIGLMKSAAGEFLRGGGALPMRALRAGAKTALSAFGIEPTTEAITQQIQQPAFAATGLTDEAPRSMTSMDDWAKSFSETYKPAVATSLFMAALGIPVGVTIGRTQQRREGNARVAKVEQATAGVRAHLDFARPEDLEQALQGFDTLAAQGALPKAATARLEQARQQLLSELQLRTTPDALSAPLDSARGQAGYLGFADRSDALSDEQLQEVAQRPLPDDAPAEWWQARASYQQARARRQELASVADHFQQQPDAVRGVTQTLLDLTGGKPQLQGGHGSLDFNLASLADDALSRYRLAGEVLLRDHGEGLGEQRRAQLARATNLLHNEANRRAAGERRDPQAIRERETAARIAALPAQRLETTLAGLAPDALERMATGLESRLALEPQRAERAQQIRQLADVAKAAVASSEPPAVAPQPAGAPVEAPPAVAPAARAALWQEVAALNQQPTPLAAPLEAAQPSPPTAAPLPSTLQPGGIPNVQIPQGQPATAQQPGPPSAPPGILGGGPAVPNPRAQAIGQTGQAQVGGLHAAPIGPEPNRDLAEYPGNGEIGAPPETGGRGRVAASPPVPPQAQGEVALGAANVPHSPASQVAPPAPPPVEHSARPAGTGAVPPGATTPQPLPSIPPETHREERPAETQAETQAETLLNPPILSEPRQEEPLPFHGKRTFKAMKGFARQSHRRVVQTIEARDQTGRVARYDLVRLDTRQYGRTKTSYQLYPQDSEGALIVDAPNRERLLQFLPNSGLTLLRQSATAEPKAAPAKTPPVRVAPAWNQADAAERARILRGIGESEAFATRKAAEWPTWDAIPEGKVKAQLRAAHRGAVGAVPVPIPAPAKPTAKPAVAPESEPDWTPRAPTITAADLVWYRDTAGWRERGGQLLRNAQGAVTGRTKWVAKESWWAAYKEWAGSLPEQAAIAQLQNAIDGKPLSTKGQELIDFIARHEAERLQQDEEAAAAINELSPDERVLLDDLEQEAVTRFGENWVESRKEAVAIRMEDASQAEYERAVLAELRSHLDAETQRLRPSEPTPARPPERGAGRPGAHAGGEAPSLLTAYSAQDLARERETVARAHAEAQAKEAADARKDAADQAAKSFVLTDQQGAPDGQKDLLVEARQTELAQEKNPAGASRPANGPEVQRPKHTPRSRVPGENMALREQQKTLGTAGLIDLLAHRVVDGTMPMGQLHVILQPFDDYGEGMIGAALRKAGATPAQLKQWGYEGVGDRYSRPAVPANARPATFAEARAALVKALGERAVADLERAGKLILHATDPTGTGAAGFVDGKGIIHLVPANLDQSALDVALHEAMHLAKDDRFAEGDRAKLQLAHATLKLVGLKNFIGNPGFNDLVQQVYRLAAEGNQAAIAALNKAQLEGRADPRVDVAEETVAYLVQYADPNLPIVRRILAAIRAALYRMGIKVKLTPNDVRALALSALKARAKAARQVVMATREAPAYSLPDFAPTAADLAEIERQMRAVKEVRDAQGRLLAPNGKPSNLNEYQWKQVRTENFKRWFGEFEYAAHQQAIDALPTIPVDFPLAATLPLVEARHQALAETRRRLLTDAQGKVSPRKVEAGNGDQIWIAMSGLKESISKNAGIQKMRILPVLDRLISNSHFVLSAPDEKPNQRKSPNVLGYRYYVAKAQLDGKPYYVKLAVREIEDGGIRRKFYDHELSEVSEAAGESGTAHLAAAGNPPATASLDHIVHHGWQKFQGDVSKVVDENGEPLVVYHGTDADFDTFNMRAGGSGSLAKDARRAAFFTTSKEVAEDFAGYLYVNDSGKVVQRFSAGANIMPVFLKVSDPTVWNMSGGGYQESFMTDALRDARKDKSDGVVFTNMRDGSVSTVGPWKKSHVIAVFNPTQVKSALGNAGTFSPRSRRIDYSQPMSDADAAEQERLWEEFQAIRARFQERQASESAFQRWFGKGVEGVTARDGKPLVLYHGTNNPAFYRWEERRSGAASGHPTAGLGFFMTADRRAAARYGDQLMELHAKIEKPYFFTDADLTGIETPQDAVRLRQKLMAQGYDGAAVSAPGGAPYVIAFRSNQVKRTSNQNPTESEDFRYSRPHRWTDALPAEVGSMAAKIGAEPASWWERFLAMRATWPQALRQGMVDRYARLLDLDRQRFGHDVLDTHTALSAWAAAKMGRTPEGPLEAVFLHGRLTWNQGALDVLETNAGLAHALAPVAQTGELNRFWQWIIANRSERLMREGREHLFSPTEIAASRALNQGQLPDGKSRATVYQQVFARYRDLQKSVLDIAEQAGLLTATQRAVWEHDFYLPYFRQAEEADATRGPAVTSGLVRQKAIERLRGGADKLGDPLQNILRNWHHLIDASLKNHAATLALDTAETLGIAQSIPAAQVDQQSVWIMRNGQKAYYRVDDPLTLDAVSAIAAPPLAGTALKALAWFKRALTLGITISPAFKAANLLRDSIQAISLSGVSPNAFRNVWQGWQATAQNSPEEAGLLAGGGIFRFGTLLEGDRDAATRRIAGFRPDTVLDSKAKIRNLFQTLQAGVAAWNRFGDRLENVNRAALYRQVRAKGGSHLQAALAARDLMDFSQSGAWPAVRFLISVVPFLNARIQGLDVLYRKGFQPLARAMTGRASAGENRQALRFASTVFAVQLASVALYLLFKDDDDFKQREQWDRDAYWWFKLGDTAYRIPKPFEVGALGTIAERLIEQLTDPHVGGKVFAERLQHMLLQTFAFNPIPQIAMPAIEVFANVDTFTERPIETLGMERLSPELRQRPQTSAAAISLSQAGLGKVGLSPVQIDHLVNGYLGWLGAQALLAGDYLLRPVMNLPERPLTRRDVPLLGDLMQRFVPDGRGSRYLTEFYDQLKGIRQAQADAHLYQQLGDVEGYRRLVASQADEFRKAPLAEAAARQLAKIGLVERQVQASRTLDRATKQKRLDHLATLKNQIARRVAPTLQDDPSPDADR